MAAAAGVRTLRVGTLVTRAGLRAPALVARMAATVGQVAGVPPVIGVGRGDLANQPENQAFGLPFGSPADRARAVEDTVAALRAPGRVPMGARPEVWVGGIGPGARDLAGRLADGWNGWALTPEELAAGLAGVRRAAEAAGRDPGASPAPGAGRCWWRPTGARPRTGWPAGGRAGPGRGGPGGGRRPRRGPGPPPGPRRRRRHLVRARHRGTARGRGPRRPGGGRRPARAGSNWLIVKGIGTTR